jgi:hypothetical protein
MIENKYKCTNCQRELDIGVEYMKTEKGVIGIKGSVPLETLSFCSEKCLRDYYDLSDLPKVPRRIP